MLRRASNANGLVAVMTDSRRERKGCDWIDAVWASFEVATINAQMYHALTFWADREGLLADAGHAARYRQAAGRLKAAFDKTTAEEYRLYVNGAAAGGRVASQ